MSTTVPPEVWSQIFWHACVDAGYTGCSISETCRFFNNIGKPTKYRSVALRGLSQVISFWHSIKSLPSHHLQIENMYILVKENDADMDAETESIHLPNQNMVDQSRAMDKMTFSTAIDVLTAAAPSLIYLYLFLEKRRETIFFPINFPRLSELVIRGRYKDYDLRLVGSLPPLLNLRKLRISNPSGDNGSKAILAIPTCAPYLTHLRLDLYTAYSKAFPPALKAALQSPPELPASNHPGQLPAPRPVDKFPASLQRLLIHHFLSGNMHRYGGGRYLRLARERIDRIVKSDPRILLFDHGQLSDKDTKFESLKEWVDRINGEMAYWVENND